MSKLFNMYTNLKQKDPDTLYVFKSGIFYILLDDDAKLINKMFDLKLTNLNAEVVKCGFPIHSIDKYLRLFSNTSLNFKIIDEPNSISYTISDYQTNSKINELLLKITNIDIENTSVGDAYNLLENLKNDAKNLLKKE